MIRTGSDSMLSVEEKCKGTLKIIENILRGE